ncbi:MAG: endolytic transglycosylase MltG [Desulfuromonadaceae bacterium]|nr:endolytic transglycosylase MltG [Desulfuromonadaceae bacterium]
MSEARRLLLAIAVGLIVLVGIPAGVLTWFGLRPVVTPYPCVLEIKPGRAFISVARELEDAGVVADSRALRLLARLQGVDRGIQAGVYRFSGNNTPIGILETLHSGRGELLSCTIPEGLNAVEIAARCSAAGLGRSERYMQLLQDNDFIATLGLSEPRIEGYLFPETYHFAPGTSEATVLKTMVAQMQKQLQPELIEGAARNGLDAHALVTLASIIQKEAANDAEMTRISAVFHNRLRRNMRLQADPTTIYALDAFNGKLTRADLRVVHPYNTYVVFGLPPGPIASPGVAALHAAAFPAEDDALYFVATRDGGHHFSKTLREHNNAVRRYRQQGK